jgi:hypothetical protein
MRITITIIKMRRQPDDAPIAKRNSPKDGTIEPMDP